MSSPEENKAIQRRLFAEFFSKGKLEVADEIFAPDHVHHFFPEPPQRIQLGPEGMKQLVVGTLSARLPPPVYRQEYARHAP